MYELSGKKGFFILRLLNQPLHNIPNSSDSRNTLLETSFILFSDQFLFFV